LKKDLSIVKSGLQVLNYCADVDDIAKGLRDVVAANMRKVSDIAGISIEDNSTSVEDDFANIEETSIQYIFTCPSGNSDPENAARHLRQLLIQPFGASLSTRSDVQPQLPLLRKTLISWMEASVGATQEWQWDLESGMQSLSLHDEETAESDLCGVKSSPSLELAAGLDHGCFAPMEDSGWSDWPIATGL
jgi:hypothetical protein